LAKGEYPLILSPASTSYDAFENFEKRGEVFSEAARSIYKKELKRKV
jgi:UDP-N-acetylmuramoylalanine-D-glutamate ligase